jgi:hypothetical protein
MQSIKKITHRLALFVYRSSPVFELHSVQSKKMGNKKKYSSEIRQKKGKRNALNLLKPKRTNSIK